MHQNATTRTLASLRQLRGQVLAALLGVLAIAFLALPSAATAQRFTPMVGLYAPAADFGQVDASGGAVDFGKTESTLAYGLSLDFGQADQTGFRLMAFFGSDSDVPASGVGCAACAPRTEVFGAAGSLVLRPIPWLGIFQPYGIAGAGAKWYSFDPQGVEDVVEDQAHFMGQVGFGVALGSKNQGPRLVAEVTDNISGFDFIGDGDGDLQHDLLLMVGLMFGG